MNFLSFIFGVVTTIVVLIFQGWIDVYLLRKPKLMMDEKKHPVRFYMVIGAWEFLFFLVGVLGAIAWMH